MTDAAECEFGFIQTLPKSEAKKVRTAVDVLAEWREATKKHGCLVPSPLAAKILNISRQRLHVYIQDGRLSTIVVEGHIYVIEKSLLDLANTDRKAGRPFRMPGVLARAGAIASWLEEETSK